MLPSVGEGAGVALVVDTEDVVVVISELVLDSVVVVELSDSVVELSSVLVVESFSSSSSSSSSSSVDVVCASSDDVVADAVMGGTNVMVALVELVLVAVAFVDVVSSSIPKMLSAALCMSLRMSRRLC